MRGARFIAAISCMSLCGCSFFTIEKTPANYRSYKYFRCTSNKVAPGFDLLWGLGGLGAGVFLATKNQPVGAAAAIVPGTVFLISSMYGFRNTSRCADALDEAASRAAQAPTPTGQARVPMLEGVSTSRDEFSGKTTLRLRLSSGGHHIVIFGAPLEDPKRIGVTVIRAGAGKPVYEPCRNLDIAAGSNMMKNENADYESKVLDSGLLNEGLALWIDIDVLPQLATGPTKFRACRDVIALTARQQALIGVFVERWKKTAAAPTAEQVESIHDPSDAVQAGDAQKPSPEAAAPTPADPAQH